MPNKIILLGSDKEKLINFLINIDNKSKAAGSNDTLLLAETKTDEAGEEVEIVQIVVLVKFTPFLLDYDPY